jgi:hypothetical protein
MATTADLRMVWRRGWDSNPRYALTAYNGLANRRLQPLGHPSARRLTTEAEHLRGTGASVKGHSSTSIHPAIFTNHSFMLQCKIFLA